MQVFRYKAIDPKNHTETGLIRATNKSEADHLLVSKKLIVSELKIHLSPSVRLSHFFRRLTSSRFGDSEKSNVYQKMATMLDAGINIVRTLEIVADTDNYMLQEAMDTIITDVRGGALLSTSCAKYPKLFSKIETNIMKSGEATGRLSTVLNRLSEEKGKIAAIKKNLQSAMVYPIIVFIAIVAVITVVTRNVIPVISQVYKDAGNASLPVVTQVIITMTDFFNRYYIVIFMFLILLIILGFSFVKKTLLGDFLWSLFKMKAPIVSSVHKSMIMAEFTNALSMLISNGVSIVEATKLSGETVSNSIYRLSMVKIAQELEKGNTISATMSAFPKLYPSMVVNMVSVGEESGSLDKMLESITKYYALEVDTKVKSLSAAFEPIMIIILGISVAVIVIAIMLPIYNLSNVYQ